MIKKVLIIALTLVLCISLFIGCSKASDEDSNVVLDLTDEDKSGAVETTSAEEAGNENGVGILNEKMIYVARISIETLEFEKTLEDIEGYVLSLGGFVQSSSISGIGEDYEMSSYTTRGYAEITYRVPASQYAGFLENIKSYGNVISESSSAENITSSYYDTEGRLKAYRTAEERLLEILSKADAVTDMLEIERELTNVRANIEGLTTQLKAWDNLVDYSTVIVAIQEVKTITDTNEPDSFGEKLIKTIEKSFTGFLDFLKGALLVFTYILPYAIVLIIIIFIIKKIKGHSFFIHKPKK
jgi:hypothetical protein